MPAAPERQRHLTPCGCSAASRSRNKFRTRSPFLVGIGLLPDFLFARAKAIFFQRQVFGIGLTRHFAMKGGNVSLRVSFVSNPRPPVPVHSYSYP